MNVVAMDRARARRKAWRRVVTAARAPLVRVSFFWLAWFMLASSLVGAVIGITLFSRIVTALYHCARVM